MEYLRCLRELECAILRVLFLFFWCEIVGIFLIIHLIFSRSCVFARLHSGFLRLSLRPACNLLLKFRRYIYGGYYCYFQSRERWPSIINLQSYENETESFRGWPCRMWHMCNIFAGFPDKAAVACCRYPWAMKIECVGMFISFISMRLTIRSWSAGSSCTPFCDPSESRIQASLWPLLMTKYPILEAATL